MMTVEEAREALETARVVTYCARDAYLEARSRPGVDKAEIDEKRELWKRTLIDFIQADVTVCAVEDFDRLPTGPKLAASIR